MNFHRIPFQFSAIDPGVRQQEYQKRFGIPTTADNMYIDFANPGTLGCTPRESNSATNSPRLQHRVPIFVEGSDQPSKMPENVSNSDSGKKPNIRVIPIEVEGAPSQPRTRQRTYSGPTGRAHDARDMYDYHDRVPSSPVKRSMQDLTSTKLKSPTGPRVCNIPIQIESRNDNLTSSTPFSTERKVPKSSSFTKSMKTNKEQQQQPADQQPEKPTQPDINAQLRKIENVLEELKSYESAVETFTGTSKDKQYRFIDEMLTRCMLNLDNVDTMGNDKIRTSRKNAVRKVQACIDKLEMKASVNAENSMQLANETVEPQEETIQGTNVKDLNADSDQGNAKDMMDDKLPEKDAIPSPDENNLKDADMEVNMTENDQAAIEIEKNKTKQLNSEENAEQSSNTAVQNTGGRETTDVDMVECHVQVENAYDKTKDFNKNETLDSELIKDIEMNDETQGKDTVDVCITPENSKDNSQTEIPCIEMTENVADQEKEVPELQETKSKVDDSEMEDVKDGDVIEEAGDSSEDKNNSNIIVDSSEQPTNLEIEMSENCDHVSVKCCDDKPNNENETLNSDERTESPSNEQLS